MSETTLGKASLRGHPADPAGDAARTLARGIGQIFFQPHWATGALIVLGIAVYAPAMAALTVLGTIVGTLAGAALGRPVGDGLEGYNPALVGAASYALLGATSAGALATVLGALACPAIAAALAWLLGNRGGAVRMGNLAAPFCIASGLIAVFQQAMTQPTPSVPVPTAEGAPPLLFLRAVLTGVAQVVLVEHWVGGAVILAGLFVAGRWVGLAALAGSTVGTTLALITGASWPDVVRGLAGYSPVLTAIALIVVFRQPSGRNWAVGLLGCLMTFAIQLGLRQSAVPVYTWPFILATWLLLAVPLATGAGRSRRG